MLFLIIFVFIGIKLVSCCRKCSKDLEENQEELTFAKVTSKNWFKVLVLLRMLLFVVCCVLGYYFSYGFGYTDKWADETVESWDHHFEGFHQHDINITLPQDCQADFQATLVENLAYIENYSLGFSDECLRNLSLDTDSINSFAPQKPTGISKFKISFKKPADKGSKYPVLVTVATDNYFSQILGLIENMKTVLHKSYPKMEAVLFDFGLSVENHKTILEICSFCHIENYPVERLSTCERSAKSARSLPIKRPYKSVYKPVLIQLVLQQHDFVMWVNGSIRFNSTSILKKLVKGTKGKSIQLPTSDEAIEERGIADDMFALLDEEPCLFQQQMALDTKLMLIRRNNFTLRAIMRPWVTSSLTYMSLPAQTKTMLTNKSTPSEDKADSSLLSIILTRLFGVKDQIFLFDFPGMYGVVSADDNSNNTTVLASNNSVNDVTINESEIIAIGNNMNHKITKPHVEVFKNENSNGTIEYLSQ